MKLFSICELEMVMTENYENRECIKYCFVQIEIGFQYFSVLNF